MDLAIYELASENRGSLTDEHAAKRDKWIARLEKVSAGELLLGLATEQSTHYELALTSDTALMHPDSSEGLI